MALVRTLRGSDTSTGSSAQTASFTPNDDCLLVAIIGGCPDGSGDPTSGTAVSGGSLTWTKRVTAWEDDNKFGGWGSWTEIWTAPVSTGASMTVTSTPGQSQDGHWISVIEITGQDTSPIGTNATGTRELDNSGPFSITLASNPASDSLVLGGITVDNWTYSGGGEGVINVGTGWTQLHDFPGIGGNETHGQTQERGSSTSTSVDWDEADADNGGGGSVAAVALEIIASAGEPEPSFTPQFVGVI